jgi:hypothetical protein
MEDQARLTPSILQNRISISIRDVVDAAHPWSFLARVREIYENSITQPDQILPRHPDLPAEVFRCSASSKTGGYISVSLVVSVEGEKVSYECKRGRR